MKTLPFIPQLLAVIGSFGFGCATPSQSPDSSPPGPYCDELSTVAVVLADDMPLYMAVISFGPYSITNTLLDEAQNGYQHSVNIKTGQLCGGPVTSGVYDPTRKICRSFEEVRKAGNKQDAHMLRMIEKSQGKPMCVERTVTPR